MEDRSGLSLAGLMEKHEHGARPAGSAGFPGKADAAKLRAAWLWAVLQPQGAAAGRLTARLVSGWETTCVSSFVTEQPSKPEAWKRPQSPHPWYSKRFRIHRQPAFLSSAPLQGSPPPWVSLIPALLSSSHGPQFGVQPAAGGVCAPLYPALGGPQLLA